MKRTVWAGLVLAVCVAGPALSASAATVDQPRRQVRSERMERLREQTRERSLQRREVRRERLAAAREQQVRQRERVREQRSERAARERGERIRRIVRSERPRVRQELRRVFRGMWR